MYDNLKSPGRNDECWCGSGRKYKKCHLDFDERLQSLYEQGFEVPQRSLLKTPEEIEGIKRSAAINIGVLDLVAERIGAGVSTEEIDKWIYDYTVEHGGIPADLDYEGYPKSVCTSINEVVCHGIPSPDDVLKDGDIVNVDCSTILDGYYSDSSRMFCIGEVSDEKRRLVEETKKALEAGLAAVKPWGCWAMWAPRCTNTLTRRAFRWCASSAATASAWSSMKIPSSATYPSPERAWCWRRAAASPSSL